MLVWDDGLPEIWFLKALWLSGIVTYLPHLTATTVKVGKSCVKVGKSCERCSSHQTKMNGLNGTIIIFIPFAWLGTWYHQTDR